MHSQNSTNNNVFPLFPPASLPNPPVVEIEVPRIVAGCFVYIYDDHAGTFLWQQVKAVREEHGQLKINVVHTEFYFHENLVAAIAFLTGGGVI